MKNLPRKLRSLPSLLVKTGRVATYLGVVVVGLSVVGVRAVHAKTKKAALAIGEPLGNLDVPVGGGNVLTINGTKLHLASARVEGTVPAVLDRLQKGCETHADGLADDLGQLDTGFATTPASGRGFPGIAMLRDEREGRGVVACFATGEQTSKAGVVKRLARFAESSDLADIGGLRYIAVHNDEQGGVRVVATWSDDPLAIGAMFPDTGDATGDDPGFAPRPRNAQRLMSARVEPAPYGAWIYGVEGTPETAVKTYESSLLALGFRQVGQGEARSRAYQNGLVDVLVTATGNEGSPTSLSVIESHYFVVKSTGGAR